MKKSLISLLILSGITFISCDNDRAIREKAAQTLPKTEFQSGSSIPGNGSLAGVQHYICPNNCKGSGGPEQGNCPVCGTAYLHNQAYHANDAQNQVPPTPNPATPPTPTPEPAQNAAGVWHYTCAKGCPGGAGSATVCATCGGTLVHNTAYHN
jgi:hypothetical protein